MNEIQSSNPVGIMPPPAAEMNVDNDPAEVMAQLGSALGQFLMDAVSNILRDNNVPEAVIDDFKDTATSNLSEVGFDGGFDSLAESNLDDVRKASDDTAKSAADGAGGSDLGSGNWLVVLAKAMGDVAGKHLKQMVLIANEISKLSDNSPDMMGGEGETLTDTQLDANATIRAENAAEMSGLQAMNQAEAQMFKLAQEMTTTVVKSIGEALSSTARKQ